MGKAQGSRRRCRLTLEPLDARVLPSAVIEPVVPSTAPGLVATSGNPSRTATPIEPADSGEDSGGSLGFIEPSALSNNSHLILSDAEEDSREATNRHEDSDATPPSIEGQPARPQVMIAETTSSNRPSQTSGHEATAPPLGPAPTIQVPPVTDPSLPREIRPNDEIPLSGSDEPGGSPNSKSRPLASRPESRTTPHPDDPPPRSTTEGTQAGFRSESPLPRAAGLIASVFPFDRTSLERVLGGPLGRGHGFEGQVSRWHDPLSVVQILLTASILTTAHRWFIRRFVDRDDEARRARVAGIIIPGIPGLPRR